MTRPRCWCCSTTKKLRTDGTLYLCQWCEAEIDAAINTSADASKLSEAMRYAEEDAGRA